MKNAIIISIVLFTLSIIPLLTIWSLNNLFKIGIAYNVSNWISVLVLLTILNSVFRGSSTPSKKDK